MPTRFALLLSRRSVFVAALFLTALTPLRAQEPAKAPETRNLILMIGDGMGPTQVQVAAEFANRTLAMQSLPVRGSLKTFSANNPVTDSAAAGTALACGHKTNNGILGQLPDQTKLASIAELARDAGKRVGVLSSVPLNHATPASFYAKVDSRNSYYDIGLQALASRFDLLGGNSLSDADGGNAQPRPAKSLWQRTEESGRKVLRTPAELQAHGAGEGPALIVPKSLYSQAGLPYGRPFDAENDLTLAQVTSKALELLDNPDGFFLMVEGGAIDWAGHANDLLANIGETLAFDEAVAVAKAFAESHPGTLLVVTADHETGGLTRQEGYRPETARAVLSRQTTNRGDLVEWLRKQVKETGQTTDAGWAVASSQFRTALGLAPELPMADVESLYRKVFEAPDKERGKAVETVVREALKRRDAAAGLKWTTGGHTATDVPLFALGPGTERFEGSHDNTQVPRLGAELLRLPFP